MRLSTHPGVDFRATKPHGQRGEQRIAAALQRLGYTVRLASGDDQRRGIDFWLTRRDGSRTSVEVKTDEAAYRTGNAFVVLVADDVRGRAGWAYTAQAAHLVHLMPQSGRYLVVPFIALRGQLVRWQRTCKQAGRRNVWPGVDFWSTGILVPLALLDRLAVWRGDA